MMLKLYDLAGAESDRRFSPYCWRVRMAIAHKGLDVETIPWRFSDKDVLTPSGQGKVPVLVHGDNWIHESWDIPPEYRAMQRGIIDRIDSGEFMLIAIDTIKFYKLHIDERIKPVHILFDGEEQKLLTTSAGN